MLDVDEENPSVVDPISEISLDFTNIYIGGTTIVQISDENPELLAGFDVVGTYYDISKTVNFNGDVIVGMPYDDTKYGRIAEELFMVFKVN